MVDMGGAETNSEMAIERLPEKKRAKVVVCNAPIVEVVMRRLSRVAVTLDKVRHAAEELYRRM